MKIARALAAAVVATFAASRGHAQPSLDRAAMAELLFDQGRKLIAAGRFPEACSKFAESERLDHGVGTLLNLADCYEKNGQLASAWTEFRAAAAAAAVAQQPDRERIARERMNALVGGMQRLAIRIPPGDASLPGLQVMRDDIRIEPALWGVAVPVDPGPHRIDVRAPRKKPWMAIIDVPAKRSALVTKSIPHLEPLPGEPESGAAPAPFGPDSTSRSSESHASSFDKATIGGLALLGGAAVGAIVGAVFGVRAVGLDGSSADHCIGDRCDATGVSLRNDARTSGTASTVAFVGAGALGVAGGALLLFGPKGRDDGVALGAGPTQGGATMVVRGGF